MQQDSVPIQSMTRFRNRLALIVPTRNRPQLLIKLLQTIQTQSVKPAQVVIVDGSDEPIKEKIKGYLTTDDTYIHVSPPSLTRQRNEGIKQLRDDITLAGYLDDDIELEPGAIEEMLRFWEQCSPDTGGAEFNIVNMPGRIPVLRVILMIFCPNDLVPGKVTRSGFCTNVHPASRDIPCDFLCGGAVVWRREILESYKYDEWYSGWAYYEDIEFSYRVSKKYPLYIVHLAKVTHNPPPFNPNKKMAFGRMNVVNRYHFVKKNPELSVGLFYGAAICEVVFNILIGIWDRDWNAFRVAQGNMSGIYHIIRRDLIQVDENFRK